jgi:stage V sporulation protein SpoVS
VAGAIANLIREKNDVIVQAIGYEAVYITVKSVIYATDYLAIDDKIHILSKLEFVNIESGDILCVRFTIRVLPNFLVYEDSVETGLHEEDLF